jgi:hypothetical protein
MDLVYELNIYAAIETIALSRSLTRHLMTKMWLEKCLQPSCFEKVID